MMKFKIQLISLFVSVLLMSCSTDIYDEIQTDKADVTFRVSLNTQTRAPQDIDFTSYNVKVYTFAEMFENPGRFLFSSEQEITNSIFTIEDLDPTLQYRFVFLALPKNQTPVLPSYKNEVSAPFYEDAIYAYISGNQTGNEVFRNILTLTPTTDSESGNDHSIVLTRQNGALQIRLSNSSGELNNVKLEVEGMSEMYLHDGTGGKVVSTGSAVQLSKEEVPAAVNDYRISVNLLPAEDVTGKGKLTLTYTNGSTKVYTLSSTQGSIPIYPNQITWLTLNGTGGDGDGNFSVHFGPEVNLDDDDWDGIQ